MGNCRNAVYLAQQGFTVEGIDISTEAIRNALERAQQAGVTITAEVDDFEGNYRIRKNYYDVIICFKLLAALSDVADKSGSAYGRSGGL